MLSRSVRAFKRSRSSPLPDMAPFAGVSIALICIFLLTSRAKEFDTGLVSNAHLPYSVTHACLHENMAIVVSINAENRLSFAVTHPEIQWASIKQVALSRGIAFTSTQLIALKTTDFLQTDVENLPRFLSLPMHQRTRVTQSMNLGALSEQQLAECIEAAKAYASTIIGNKTIYLSLKIDAEVKALQVERLIDLLQSQGINCFTLETQHK